MLLAFFHAAFATRWIVYGTSDKTIIASMKIGNRELFSSAVFPISQKNNHNLDTRNNSNQIKGRDLLPGNSNAQMNNLGCRSIKLIKFTSLAESTAQNTTLMYKATNRSASVCIGTFSLGVQFRRKSP